ncbi:zinc knuckle [Ostertagia ostertagi]
MTTTLSTKQGMLTKTMGRLSALLDNVPEETQPAEREDDENIPSRKLQLMKLKKSIEIACASVETALNAYTTAADTLDKESLQGNPILDKISSNASIAQDLILRAQSSRIELEMALEELSMVASDELQTAPMQLAPIPIPKFSGKVWEWESFWSAFEFSIHSRKIEDIYKMNYLMESLEGEAKKSLKRFQISGSTYAMAIAHLKKKFGNPQLLLEELARQLEGCCASTNRIEDQMTLYEELSSILNQMALKGECIDTVVLQKQVLSKFSERVQRHVLRKKHEQTASEPWTTELLLSHISDFLDTEMEIKHHLQEQNQDQPYKPSQNNIVKRTTDIRISKEGTHTCFYCRRGNHSPRDCSEYSTREQRLDHLKRFSLCMNCGEANHIASACTKGACRLCHQKGHHTSICPQTIRTTEQRPTSFQRKPPTTNENPKPPAQRKTRQHFVSSTPNEDDDDEDNVEAATCMKTTSIVSKTKQCVLVGEAKQTILNTKTSSMGNINDVELLDWNRHSTLDSAQTSIAYALRFLRELCCRVQEKTASRITTQVPELRMRPDSKFITVAERKAALQVIIRAHQSTHVTQQLKRSLKNLNLQPDQYGILRCRGRLDNANIPESAKHPITTHIAPPEQRGRTSDHNDNIIEKPGV